tara:strand:+ start:226 stop:453 length:228 start_codon:yes stop_codon:yes gene_type:complete
MAEISQIFLARELDRKHSAAYNQELQSPASPEKKGKRAFFDTIDSHQTPVAGPDSPVSVRMSFLHAPGSSNSQTL